MSAVCGTTGESRLFTVSERKEILAAWVAEAKGELKVVAHVGCESLHETKELAAHAQAVGADGVAALPPTYYKPATLDSLVEVSQPLSSTACVSYNML